jgi:hypothetical protein
VTEHTTYCCYEHKSLAVPIATHIEGSKSRSQKSHVCKYSEKPIVYPLLKVQVVRKFAHGARESCAVPQERGLLNQPDAIKDSRESSGG